MSRLEHELLELGGDLTAALDDVGLPAALLDQAGLIRWQNHASIVLRGDRVGSNWAELVAPEERPKARETITRILCAGEPAEFTLNVLNARGGYTPVQISLLSPGGDAAGA